MQDILHWIHNDLKDIKDKKLFRFLTEIETAQTPEITIGGRRHILLSSNSYLGLTVNPKVVEAAKLALSKYGSGSAGSRLVSGSSGLHRRLETRIARFKNAESAILFSSGYLANVGVISALVKEGDTIYSDELNHASIIDGCRLSRAEVKIYKHLRLDHLSSMLKTDKHISGKRLIISDTVFSMDGDLVPLPELVEISERYGCMLMVDEAHATGILGDRGSGATEHFGVEDRVPIVMGTLSKAIGSMGGYIAGSQRLIDYLRNRARSYIFDTSLPPPSVAASLAAIDIVEKEPERRQYLWSIIKQFKAGLDCIGLRTIPSHSAVVPVLIGDAERTLSFAGILREKGIYTPAVRPPSVPHGKCRIRATLMATHTEEHIAEVLEAFKFAYNEFAS